MQLIERYLPQYQFAERHERYISATPARVLELITRPEVVDDPITRHLIAVRELPGRLAGLLGLRGMAREGSAFSLSDFTYLGRDGDHEVAFGLAGRFWRMDYGLVVIENAQAFDSLATPGLAKLVMNFTAVAQGNGTQLATHTRIYCGDIASERRFRAYWLLIRPASGLIRQRLLARVQRAALRLD